MEDLKNIISQVFVLALSAKAWEWYSSSAYRADVYNELSKTLFDWIGDVGEIMQASEGAKLNFTGVKYTVSKFSTDELTLLAREVKKQLAECQEVSFNGQLHYLLLVLHKTISKLEKK